LPSLIALIPSTPFPVLSSLFSFSCSRTHRYLHSFPTRRSSDLVQLKPFMPQIQLLHLLNKLLHLLLAIPKLMPSRPTVPNQQMRSEEHTSELQSRFDLVCRLLLEKKKKKGIYYQYLR